MTWVLGIIYIVIYCTVIVYIYNVRYTVSIYNILVI